MSVKGVRASRLPLRLAWLYAGLAGFGLSLGLLVRARLGLDPWDVLSQGIARRTGIPIGWVVDMIGAVVLLTWLPLRQRPGPGVALGGSAGVGTLAYALAIGPLVHLLLPRLTLRTEDHSARPAPDPAPSLSAERGASPCSPCSSA